MVVQDSEGVVTAWSAGAAALTGFAAEDVVGRHAAKLYQDPAQAAALLSRAASTRRGQAEVWRVRKDGTRFLANVVVTPLP